MAHLGAGCANCMLFRRLHGTSFPRVQVAMCLARRAMCLVGVGASAGVLSASGAAGNATWDWAGPSAVTVVGCHTRAPSVSGMHPRRMSTGGHLRFQHTLESGTKKIGRVGCNRDRNVCHALTSSPSISVWDMLIAVPGMHEGDNRSAALQYNGLDSHKSRRKQNRPHT